MGAERDRIGRDLDEQLRRGFDRSGWDLWGPWVAERAWGTVREDYSADGDAWSYFPHDHARSRAYRWNEDGMAAVCDRDQYLCLGLALWNGRDPILKERMFGLSGPEGNRGEDVKEYWWYLDAVPSSAWLRWRYHYPQRAFPYDELVRVNRERGRTDPEYELLDTGVFDDDRYWVVEVDYAKDDPRDLLMRVRVRNLGPDPETLHVLPTLWFRNTWSWEPGSFTPSLRARDGRVVADHPALGRYFWEAAPGPDGAPPAWLFCENETNRARLFGEVNLTPYPKDGINDHVVAGAPTVNPEQVGTKAAAWYRVTVPAGGAAEIRLRLVHEDVAPVADALGAHFTEAMAGRQAEADEFYAELAPPDATDDERLVMRQAFAGLLWTLQYFHFDVARWQAGDPGQPPPPAGRKAIRNLHWSHLHADDVISMPDKWEYPWFATWDLAFHAVALANVDPLRAKQQLLLFTREWYQHPNGALPAYEWNFDDVNPPVHAWAALRVFVIDGAWDYEFLARAFNKLVMLFTWWVNRKDEAGNNVFEGGFLGLDNISPIDRSKLPVAGRLEQTDATAWMALFSLDMFKIAVVLSMRWPFYQDHALKFLQHFALIAAAMQDSGMWEESAEGFYYDRLITSSGQEVSIPVRSMVGLLPLMASSVVPADLVRALPDFAFHARRFLRLHQEYLRFTVADVPGGDETFLLTMVPVDRLRRIAEVVFDEQEFLSPHGLRSLSKAHQDQPVTIEVEGITASIAYEPAESTSPMFGGNSNWRGPVWFPVNYLLIESLYRYHDHYGDTVILELPTGSGRRVTLAEAADELVRRLTAIFLRDPTGRRPVYGTSERFQTDPEWRDLILFYEYFHGDDGHGLGASHQTGWTGLVGHLLTGTGVRGRSLAEIHDQLRATRTPG